MIIETQAVGPFFKNGFVVGCEETREAVLIDPGDEVATLLAFGRAADADDSAHPADPRARRSRHRRRRREARARRAGLPAPRRSVSLRPRGRVGRACSGCRSSRSRRSTLLRAGRGDRVRRLRGRGRITRPGTARAACACRSAGRARPARSCSSATRCSPARSGGPTCPAATSTCSSPRSATCCLRSATMRSSTRGTGRTRRSARSGGPIRFFRHG